MSKETENIDLAEREALNIPVVMWRFCAYKTEKDYESGEHYFVKDFLKHHKMKNYSAKHSKKEKRSANTLRFFCGVLQRSLEKPPGLFRRFA